VKTGCVECRHVQFSSDQGSPRLPFSRQIVGVGELVAEVHALVAGKAVGFDPVTAKLPICL
jgi:hypothetical protein